MEESLCVDDSHGSHVDLTCIPSELLQNRTLAVLDCTSVSRFRSVSVACKQEASADGVWTAIHEALWPPWTLLKETSVEHLTARERVAMRWHGRMPLRLAHGVRSLEGVAIDDYDGNSTPVTALVGFRDGSFGAHVSAEAGTLHNSPTRGVWVGRYHNDRADDDPEDALQTWTIEWEESLGSSRSLWIYKGTICKDGLSIHGKFHFKLFPRKTGTFLFKAKPPADAKRPVNMLELGCLIFKEQGGFRRPGLPSIRNL